MEARGELRRESSHGESKPPRESGRTLVSQLLFTLSPPTLGFYTRIRVRRPKRHNCTRSLAARRRRAFLFRRTMREYLAARPDILMLKGPSTLLLEMTRFFTRGRLPTCVHAGPSVVTRNASHYYSYSLLRSSFIILLSLRATLLSDIQYRAIYMQIIKKKKNLPIVAASRCAL